MRDEYQPSDDDGLLAEVRERMQTCVDAEQRNRADGLADLKFLAGEQWPEAARRQRTVEQRPCLTINKLPTFLHQVTNDQRKNKPGLKVHPVGDGADVERADVIQGIIRHIEYASNADIAYDTAVNSAAAIGFGYFRLTTDYVSPDSFDQEIRFKRIRNAFTVYLDPSSQEPDGSDIRFAILTAEMPKEEFERQYPKAQASAMSLDLGAGDAGRMWVGDDFVRVAEYYRIEREAGTLVRLVDGSTAWADELPPNLDEAAYAKDAKGKRVERASERLSVRWYKVTGVEVLERADIPCDWIPVFPVYGDELDIEGKVIRSGMVRHAKDPAQMYNYWVTSATEEISLRPKTPYIGAEGQFEGHEREWQQANVRSFSYLEYKPTTVAGQIAPPPARQAMVDVPAGVLAMAMHAADDIKQATGIFDASLGARGNETTGKAIIARQRQGDTANFHYADGLNRTIRHAGRCLLSMIPRVYDTERVVQILRDDETIDHVSINQPIVPPQRDEKTGAIRDVLNDITVGKYAVTVSSGPSYSTMRQEAADAMIQFGQSWPKLMDIAGDKVVKAMDWPDADDIAERIARTIPPQIRDDEDGGTDQNMVQTPQGPITPEQASQVMSQMAQALQQLQQQLGEAQSGLDKARIQAEAQVQVAQINAESREDVEEIKGYIAMLLQRMQPPPALVAATTDNEGPQAGPSAFTPPGTDAPVDQVTSVPPPGGQTGLQ